MAAKTAPYFSKQCNGIVGYTRRGKRPKKREERRRRGRLVSPGWSYRLTFPLEEISRRHRGGTLHYVAETALIIIITIIDFYLYKMNNNRRQQRLYNNNNNNNIKESANLL